MIDLQKAIDGLPFDQQLSVITEYALHSLDIAKFQEAGEEHKRGEVLGLNAQQRLARALYLAGETELSTLDDFVRRDASTPAKCPDIYYLLKDHNGGKDPTASDPADRWTESGRAFVNRTCDCIGGACWVGGWDRYQPVRFAYLYGGWINTDSMLMDARGKQKCFRTIPEPEPGCYVVCASGSPGHRIGHIGTVVGVPTNWRPDARSCWAEMGVVDVAYRTPNPANRRTTAVGWFATDASFIVPAMSP